MVPPEPLEHYLVHSHQHLNAEEPQSNGQRLDHEASRSLPVKRQLRAKEPPAIENIQTSDCDSREYEGHKDSRK